MLLWMKHVELKIINMLHWLHHSMQLTKSWLGNPFSLMNLNIPFLKTLELLTN